MAKCDIHIWNTTDTQPCWKCEELKYSERKKVIDMAKETCVMCGKETPYDINDHVDMRFGYVEGLGQTCKDCNRVHNINEVIIEVPGKLIRDTPNDQELGGKIRSLLS
jgi:hypothetical protein